MKKVYTFVFVLSLVLLILFCTPALPSKLPFVDRLALNPEKWELKLNDPQQKIFGEEEASGKAKLLAFLQRYRYTYVADVGWLASGLVVAAFFSLLGRMRETWLEKHLAGPDATPNGGRAAPSANSGVKAGPPSVS